MPDVHPTVHIALGTYNGARFLGPQLDSILSQTWPEWQVLIRDDGSTDETPKIIGDFASSDPRIQQVTTCGRKGGPVENFSNLAEAAFAANARYVMFADQDDVWHATKVERTLRCMLDAERVHGADSPILVHTDLEVVDERGRTLNPSFMRLQRIRHEARNPLRTLLVQNFVTGCTMMVNRPLLTLGIPIPRSALMHDWWFAACAAACGRIEFIPDQTISYRRHGTNTVAVRGFWRTLNPFVTDWRSLWSVGKRSHARAVQQAQALAQRLEERDGADIAAKRLVAAFVALHQGRVVGVARAARAAALGLRSQTLPRTSALYARLALWHVNHSAVG